MRDNDARRLNHKTLEAMRERAVRQVQEGESPEVVARFWAWTGRRSIGWLAAPARRVWCVEGEPVFGHPPQRDARARSGSTLP